jgi:glycosyltransferase involved in cell wall biosynthesis
MDALLVSCIVPVLNGERYLAEALDSIVAQSYRPIEIIVADDGSTDGTPTVAARYGDQVTFRSQATAGPAATRNLGLRAVRGAFVAFLDADDLWHPEKLARQLARFAARPEIGICVTHVRHFWIPELTEEERRFQGHRRSEALPGYYTSTLLARRTVFDTVGEFNPALWHSDSTDWFLRAAEHGAVVELLPEVLTYKRLHHTNLSRREAEASRQEYIRLMKASLDRRRRQGGGLATPHGIPASERRHSDWSAPS